MDEKEPPRWRAPIAYPASSRDPDRPRAVWVDLEALFPPDPDGDPSDGPGGEPAAVPGGLVPFGEVHGLLHRWARTRDGRWIAVVSYRLPYADVATHSSPGIEVKWTPVPAAAVRPYVGPGRPATER